MIEGNDGGAVVTFNGGETWSGVYNQPTAEFYHVITDTQTPYRIYGAQQDNTTITIPSRAPIAGITGAGHVRHRRRRVGVTSRSDRTIQRGVRRELPGHHHALYDRRTGPVASDHGLARVHGRRGREGREVPFQWTCPIVLSPHDPNVLYHAGNRVFRSRDEGTSWAAISPDLTRNDPSKLGPSGGPVTKDNTVPSTTARSSRSPSHR